VIVAAGAFSDMIEGLPRLAFPRPNRFVRQMVALRSSLAGIRSFAIPGHGYLVLATITNPQWIVDRQHRDG